MKYLNQLLEQKILTGYNFYSFPLNEISPTQLILRNMHETSVYLDDVKEYLSKNNCLERLMIRKRKTSFLCKPDFRIRDDNGEIYPKLKIKRKGELIDLNEIKGMNLIGTINKNEQLIADDEGYEIVLSSNSRIEIGKLAGDFLKYANIKNKNAWDDAYKLEVIILHGIEELDGYKPTKEYSKLQKDKEISFLARDLSPKIQRELAKRKFTARTCLVNKNFKY